MWKVISLLLLLLLRFESTSETKQINHKWKMKVFLCIDMSLNSLVCLYSRLKEYQWERREEKRTKHTVGLLLPCYTTFSFSTRHQWAQRRKTRANKHLLRFFSLSNLTLLLRFFEFYFLNKRTFSFLFFSQNKINKETSSIDLNLSMILFD